MKRAITLFALLIASGAAAQPSPEYQERIRRVTTLPATGEPGFLYVLLSSTADPTLHVYTTTGFIEVAQVDSATFTTLTATTSNVSTQLNSNGDASLGSDELDLVTVRSPTIFQVRREDFYGVGHTLYAENYNAPAVTDASENQVLLAGSSIGQVHYRWEQAFAGTAAFLDGEYLDLDVDDADNDGIDITFGSNPDDSAGLCDEDLISATVGCYAEVSVVIADISETDSLYFGWRLAAAYQDAGAYTGYDTSAFFVLQDAAGDLDIETELNAGGTLNDDTGTTWADGQEKVLKVVVFADTVEFYLDGVQVAQTNAVLNFDNGDELVVSFGYLNDAGDATPAPGVRINYVEIGRVQ